MNNESEMRWKEKSVVITGSIKVLRSTEKNHENTWQSSVPGPILNQGLPENKRYSRSQLDGTINTII
jgi:hypothetical protein